MPRRQPAPFFKKSHNAWYVQLDGKQLRLSEEYDDALTKCGELLKARKHAAKFAAKFTITGAPERYTLGRLFNEFLATAFVGSVGRNKSFYEEKLTPLVAHLGTEFPPEELKPLHVKQWIAAHPQWKKGTARTVWQAVKHSCGGENATASHHTPPSATRRSPGQPLAPSSSHPSGTQRYSPASPRPRSGISSRSRGRPVPGHKSS